MVLCGFFNLALDYRSNTINCDYALKFAVSVLSGFYGYMLV
jgi:hypothetical protein